MDTNENTNHKDDTSQQNEPRWCQACENMGGLAWKNDEVVWVVCKECNKSLSDYARNDRVRLGMGYNQTKRMPWDKDQSEIEEEMGWVWKQHSSKI